MTYNTEISKTEIPPFVELYEIQFPEFILYLTPYFKPVSFGSNIYQPCVMERTDFTQEKDSERTVTIHFATKEDVSLEFLQENVPRIKVIIRRYFPEANVSRVIYVGEGNMVGLSERVLALRVTDLLSMKKIKCPPLIYSSYCNNTLFDKRCKVPRGLHTYRTQVQTSDEKILYASIFGQMPENYFQYGYVEFNSHSRMITFHDRANQCVYLHAPFDEPVSLQVVTIFAGCDKSPQTCRDRFNNLQNFLGFPYIPTKNPVIWGIK